MNEFGTYLAALEFAVRSDGPVGFKVRGEVVTWNVQRLKSIREIMTEGPLNVWRNG